MYASPTQYGEYTTHMIDAMQTAIGCGIVANQLLSDGKEEEAANMMSVVDEMWMQIATQLGNVPREIVQ